MPDGIHVDFAGYPSIGDTAADVDLSIRFALTDLDQTWAMTVRRGVLNVRKGALTDPQAHRHRGEGRTLRGASCGPAPETNLWPPDTSP
jgi:alkyl sulfatase BDS1-like metallo-beta-lactamase superfamily hydrolase